MSALIKSVMAECSPWQKFFRARTLRTLVFQVDPANDTALAIEAQQTALRKVCDDQRCHANLPATESCGVNSNPSTTAQMTWGLFSSASRVDETESDLPDAFYWPSAVETSSSQPTLALPSATSESTSPLLTPAAAGAMILGATSFNSYQNN